MRQTRIDLIRGLAQCLKPGGTLFLEFKVYPGCTENKIPHNHAHWTENKVAKATNSRADVWITPDAIGLVYQDLSLYLKDVGMIETSLAVDHYAYDPDAIYQYKFNPLFVHGTLGEKLYEKLS